MNAFVRVFVRTAIIAALGTVFATGAIANPPGLINLGPKIDQFNVIAKPGGWDPTAGNACNGSRIFFALNNGGPDNTMGTITWTLDPTVGSVIITDCNGTDGTATVTAPENLNFVIAIRVQGPVSSQLNLVCTVIAQNAGDNLCIIGAGQFKKGNSFTKISLNVANNLLEGILWQLSGDWKIFDVRLYQTN